MRVSRVKSDRVYIRVKARDIAVLRISFQCMHTRSFELLLQLILTSFHSCTLFRLVRGGDNGDSPVPRLLSAIWLVCMKLSLARLLSSPPSARLGGAEAKSAVDTSDGPPPTLRANRSCL